MPNHPFYRGAPARLVGRVAGYFTTVGSERASRRSFASMETLDDRLLRDIGCQRESEKYVTRF